MRRLEDLTVVYVAPRPGTSGVSDYADDVVAELRTRVGDVVEIRHGGAGEDDVAEIHAARARVADAIDAAPGPVVLHAECSGAVLVPFWVLPGQRAAVRSATLHDAPLAAHLPLRTRTVARSRLLSHGLHLPVLPLHVALERRVLRDVVVSALTESGAAEIRRVLRRPDVAVSFLPRPERAPLPAPVDRPRAIGMFGYVYRGKGFDQLARLRADVDPTIAIRVAGRGTERLPRIPGVEVLGGVEGAAEDAFFGSIRAIVVPYSRRTPYGPTVHVASSVVARAIGYRTPVVALGYPGLGDEALRVEGDVEDLARVVEEVVLDDDLLLERTAHVDALHRTLTASAAVDRLVDAWRPTLAARTV